MHQCSITGFGTEFGSWHGPPIQKLLSERRGKIETRPKIPRVAFVSMRKQLRDGARSGNLRTNTSKLLAIQYTHERRFKRHLPGIDVCTSPGGWVDRAVHAASPHSAMPWGGRSSAFIDDLMAAYGPLLCWSCPHDVRMTPESCSAISNNSRAMGHGKCWRATARPVDGTRAKHAAWVL